MVSIVKFILSKTATLTLNISLTTERIWMKPMPPESSCENLQKMQEHFCVTCVLHDAFASQSFSFVLYYFFFFFPPLQMQHEISQTVGHITMKLCTCIKYTDAQVWFNKPMTLSHDLDLQRSKVIKIHFGHISVTAYTIVICNSSNCRSHQVLHFIQ